MSRHAGRIAAVQLLYSLDTCGDLEQAGQTEETGQAGQAGQADAQLERHVSMVDTESKGGPAIEFALDLCRGIVMHLSELDDLLQQASANWRLERMSRVDRSILRLAAFELSHRADVPPPVVIDEAIELARELGSSESRSFINGVLGKVVELVGR